MHRNANNIYIFIMGGILYHIIEMNERSMPWSVTNRNAAKKLLHQPQASSVSNF